MAGLATLRQSRPRPDALAWLLASLAVLACAGCSESVRVLEPEQSTTPMLGGGDNTPLPRVDAGQDAPDLPDPPPSSSTATPTTDQPCGGCPLGQLCSAFGCVDPVGNSMVESGRLHSCLVTSGRLYCWGGNGSGQLGVGDQDNRPELTRVGANNDWLAVSAGEAHTCGIRAPGVLYCWGHNSKGALGVGDTGMRIVPEQVGELSDWEGLNCGGENCCAMRDGGRLYCWGDNLEGKPGQDDPYSAPDVLEPREVVGDRRYREVALGQGHVNAITVDGQLLGWGRNSMVESGTGSEAAHLRAPAVIGDSSDWVSVAAGQHHSCAVRADGGLFCWGSGDFGELGMELTDAQLVEMPAPAGDAVDWESVAVGWFHSCGVRYDGSLYCWGRAIEGQLGQGGGDPIPKPTLIAPERAWQRPVLGGFHTCALDLEDDLFCWGENAGGQLGVGDLERRHTPTAVPTP